MMVTVMFVLTGMVLIGVSVPLILRRVPPNGLYGLRVPATFADERVWFEANARSGRDFAILGGMVILLAVVLPVIPGITEESYAVVCTIFVLAGVIGSAIIGWRRANRLLDELRRRDR